METAEFLEALYKDLPGGALSVTVKASGGMRTKWFPSGQYAEMAAFIEKYGATYNTYIGVNPRENPLGKYSRGEKKDVSCVVAFFTDHDIKGPAHKETRLPETQEALLGYLNSLPLKPSYVVHSGNGLHAYWFLKGPIVTDSDELRDEAESRLKGWERYINSRALQEHGWHFDTVCDLPRMLRAPGTTNFKTDDRPACRVIYSSDVRYDLSAFEPYIGEAEQAPPKSSSVDTSDAFAMMGSGSAQELMDGCAFLQYCRDEAQSLPEPMWHAAISNLALTADGQEMIHEISRPYPGYTYAETRKKYENAVRSNKVFSTSSSMSYFSICALSA